MVFFFFQAEDGIRDIGVTGVQTCALPILNLWFIVRVAEAFVLTIIITFFMYPVKFRVSLLCFPRDFVVTNWGI